jgi:hypothetical protein
MTNPDTSGMLRFLTDELQEAEDAGERGAFYLRAVFDSELLTIPFSLDCGTCTSRLGWHQSIIESDQYV